MENTIVLFVIFFPIEVSLMLKTMWKQFISQQVLFITVTFALLLWSLGKVFKITKQVNTSKLFYFNIPGFSDPSQFNQFIQKDTQDGKHYCTICNKFCHKVITVVRNHVEAVHFPSSFSYVCNICSESFTNKKSLYNHNAKHK